MERSGETLKYILSQLLGPVILFPPFLFWGHGRRWDLIMDTTYEIDSLVLWSPALHGFLIGLIILCPHHNVSPHGSSHQRESELRKPAFLGACISALRVRHYRSSHCYYLDGWSSLVTSSTVWLTTVFSPEWQIKLIVLNLAHRTWLWSLFLDWFGFMVYQPLLFIWCQILFFIYVKYTIYKHVLWIHPVKLIKLFYF